MKRQLLLLICAVFAVVGCSKDEPQRPVRSDYIKVYDGATTGKYIDNLQVPFEGVAKGEIHVLSNVPLKMDYYVDQNDIVNDWFRINPEPKQVAENHYVYYYEADAVIDGNTIDRRSSSLNFSNPLCSFGKFMSVRQGYENLFVEDYSEMPGGNVCLTDRETFVTKEYEDFKSDYFDYISFNAWAQSDNEFMTKNITLDVTVSTGCQFYDTGRTTFRVNVPLGTAADKSNLKYLLLSGVGGRMDPKVKFTFSVNNDNLVYVHIDNLAGYKVKDAELGTIIEDEEYYEQDGEDWI